MKTMNLQVGIWGDEWYFFLLNDKLWEMMVSFKLIDQLRSNVWVSHLSFQAAEEDSHLSDVLSRSLPSPLPPTSALHQICQQLFAIKMSDLYC